jgi:serine/threonine protein kinase
MQERHRQALPAGTQLHEYELLDVLGSGGFGVVYLAHDHGLDRQVVIKEYLPSGCAVRVGSNTVLAMTPKDEDTFRWGLERFLQEARSLAEFRNHPNIVSVLRHFNANNTGYMVMEYAGTFSLQEYLEQRETLTEAQLHAVIFPLLEALEVVHAKGIIHRDLKPGNILINAQEQPVLIDFGSARQAVGEKSMTSVVTHGYSPLEQYTQSTRQGEWTDIYALAAVMYRCVTGNAPPNALERVTTPDVFLPCATQTGDRVYSPALLAAIDWGLQVRLEERPVSIAAWLPALQQVDLPTPPPPPPPDLWERVLMGLKHSYLAVVQRLAMPWLDRRRLLAPALSVLLLGGVGWLGMQYVEEQERRQKVQAEAVHLQEQAQQKALEVAKAAEIAKAKRAEEVAKAEADRMAVIKANTERSTLILKTAETLHAGVSLYKTNKKNLSKLMEAEKKTSKKSRDFNDIQKTREILETRMAAYEASLEQYRNVLGRFCSGENEADVTLLDVESKYTPIVKSHILSLCVKKSIQNNQIVSDLSIID